MSYLKYKVGDKVRIKDIDWYNNEPKDAYGMTWCGRDLVYAYGFGKGMVDYCGKVLTVIDASDNVYIMEGLPYCWTDEMIECKIEE